MGHSAVNKTKGITLAENLEIANTFWRRFRGLMYKKELKTGNGLYISPCNSIHMFFMRFPLDIVFVDKQFRVLHTIESIKPWRISPIIKKSTGIFELPMGTLKSSGTVIGDYTGIS